MYFIYNKKTESGHFHQIIIIFELLKTRCYSKKNKFLREKRSITTLKEADRRRGVEAVRGRRGDPYQPAQR
jgi:hypothetical protein